MTANAPGGAPLVSAIVTAYNSSGTIVRAIDSIRAQTMDNLEIIAVDDASQDQTVNVIQAIDEPRLRLFRNEQNRGIGGAKNVGVEAARGEYIAFVDSDDEWTATKLESQLSALRKDASNCPLSFTAFWVRRQGSSKVVCRRPRRYGTWLQSIVMGETFSLGSTLLATKQCFQKVGLFNEGLRRLQDRDWTLRYLRLWDRFEFVGEPLATIHNSGFPDPEMVRAAVDGLFRLHEQSLRERDPWLARAFRSSLDFEVAVAEYRCGNVGAASREFLRAFVWAPRNGAYFFRRIGRKIIQRDMN